MTRKGILTNQEAMEDTSRDRELNSYLLGNLQGPAASKKAFEMSSMRFTCHSLPNLSLSNGTVSKP